MQRILLRCSSAEFINHLKWARDNGVVLRWMGVGIEDAIQIVTVDAEMESAAQIGVESTHCVDMEDPEHIILCMMKWGVAAQKDSVQHRLPMEGASIYESVVEIKSGKVDKSAPRYGSWECWLDGDRLAINRAESLNDFQEVFFGPAGLIVREIALLQRLITEGYFAHGVSGDKVLQRWGSPQIGIEALTELLRP